jgi:hypothetical protein
MCRNRCWSRVARLEFQFRQSLTEKLCVLCQAWLLFFIVWLVSLDPLWEFCACNRTILTQGWSNDRIRCSWIRIARKNVASTPNDTRNAAIVSFQLYLSCQQASRPPQLASQTAIGLAFSEIYFDLLSGTFHGVNGLSSAQDSGYSFMFDQMQRDSFLNGSSQSNLLCWNVCVRTCAEPKGQKGAECFGFSWDDAIRASVWGASLRAMGGKEILNFTKWHYIWG